MAQLTADTTGEAGHSPRTFRNQRLFDADREVGRRGDRTERRWIGTGTASGTGDVVRNFGSRTGRALTTGTLSGGEKISMRGEGVSWSQAYVSCCLLGLCEPESDVRVAQAGRQVVER